MALIYDLYLYFKNRVKNEQTDQNHHKYIYFRVNNNNLNNIDN